MIIQGKIVPGEMMTELTIANLMALLPEVFQPHHAQGVNAAVNCILTGPDGSDWGVTIRNQECKAVPGKLENANITMTVAAEDVLDIFTGKLDLTRAFMTGRLQASGDMRLALRLAELFDLRDPRLRQWEKTFDSD
jgi:alkyl sulfatase BDS1-like metallo-beta-lactamase superfamily hydrolase